MNPVAKDHLDSIEAHFTEICRSMMSLAPPQSPKLPRIHMYRVNFGAVYTPGCPPYVRYVRAAASLIATKARALASAQPNKFMAVSLDAGCYHTRH